MSARSPARRATAHTVPNYVPAVEAFVAQLAADGIIPGPGDLLDVGHDTACGLYTRADARCTCSPTVALRRGLSAGEIGRIITHSWRDLRTRRAARRN